MNKLAEQSSIFGMKIAADNVNDASFLGLQALSKYGQPSESRGIKTVRCPGPVSTIYRNPTRRVLFGEVRDANPFFHLIGDALWLLSGSNKIALPTMFLGRYADFSDDGVHTHGSYGYRLRHWGAPTVRLTGDTHGFDQLMAAVRLLRERPDTRQCVLSIWDPARDLGVQTVDMPCNDMVMFDIVDGFLNMQVVNRSNDAVLGCYGANVVQFSMLQEIVAALVGVTPGYYVQSSWNFHVYETDKTWQHFKNGVHDGGHVFNHYMTEDVQPWPVAYNAGEAEQVLNDCRVLAMRAESGNGTLTGDWQSTFFNAVVDHMLRGYFLFKEGRFIDSIKALNAVQAPDWRIACQEWVLRRKEVKDTADAVFLRAAARVGAK
jgi:hypothetical protein